MAMRRARVREMTRVSFIISPLLFRALNQAQASLSGPLLRQQRLHVRWSRPLYSDNAPSPARTTYVTTVSLPQKAVRIDPDWPSSPQKPGFVERQEASSHDSKDVSERTHIEGGPTSDNNHEFNPILCLYTHRRLEPCLTRFCTGFNEPRRIVAIASSSVLRATVPPAWAELQKRISSDMRDES